MSERECRHYKQETSNVGLNAELEDKVITKFFVKNWLEFQQQKSILWGKINVSILELMEGYIFSGF